MAACPRPVPANRGDIESVLPHRPTVILTMGGGARGTARIARAMGIRLIRLPNPTSPAEVGQTLRQVAALLRAPHRADDWNSRLARLRPPVRARDALFLSGNQSGIPGGTAAAGWFRLAGFRPPVQPRGGTSLESLVLAQPALILRSDYRRGQVSQSQRWLSHRAVRRLPQIATDGRRWTCSGPLMLDEVERLRALP